MKIILRLLHLYWGIVALSGDIAMRDVGLWLYIGVSLRALEQKYRGYCHDM